MADRTAVARATVGPVCTWVLGNVLNIVRSLARAEQRSHALSCEPAVPFVEATRFFVRTTLAGLTTGRVNPFCGEHPSRNCSREKLAK